MDDLKQTLNSIFKNKKYNSLEDIVNDKSLAKIGDLFINLLYSTAKSKILGLPFHQRVWDDCMAEAMKNSNLSQHVSRKKDKGKLADACEALVLYAWLTDLITINEIISTLVIDGTNFNHSNLVREKEFCINSFTRLLDLIKTRIKFE